MAFTANHPEWRDFKRDVLESQIEALKETLINPMLTVEETAMTRGRIIACREIIAQVENKGADRSGGYSYEPKPFDEGN